MLRKQYKGMKDRRCVAVLSAVIILILMYKAFATSDVNLMDGSKEKVAMATSALQQDKLNIPEDYISRSDLIMYLNTRIGIKESGVVTYACDGYKGEGKNAQKKNR